MCGKGGLCVERVTPEFLLPGIGWHLALETYLDEACSLPPVASFFCISSSREIGLIGTRRLGIKSPFQYLILPISWEYFS